MDRAVNSEAETGRLRAITAAPTPAPRREEQPALRWIVGLALIVILVVGVAAGALIASRFGPHPVVEPTQNLFCRDALNRRQQAEAGVTQPFPSTIEGRRARARAEEILKAAQADVARLCPP